MPCTGKWGNTQTAAAPLPPSSSIFAFFLRQPGKQMSTAAAADKELRILLYRRPASSGSPYAWSLFLGQSLEHAGQIHTLTVNTLTGSSAVGCKSRVCMPHSVEMHCASTLYNASSER